MVKVADTVVAVEVTPETAMPGPETVTAVAPAVFVPAMVTGTTSPAAPLLGVMDVKTALAPSSSTAPMSGAPVLVWP
jgi:hypothetical protein